MASGGAWQDAQRKAWFEPFSKETGIKIVEQEYLGDLGKVKAMVDTGNVPIDLVTVETATVLQGCDAGILELPRLFKDCRSNPNSSKAPPSSAASALMPMATSSPMIRMS